jgi:hypothetical protein
VPGCVFSCWYLSGFVALVFGLGFLFRLEFGLGLFRFVFGLCLGFVCVGLV